eukprot:5119535-Pleurochrysis_carterae.AAC.1
MFAWEARACSRGKAHAYFALKSACMFRAGKRALMFARESVRTCSRGKAYACVRAGKRVHVRAGKCVHVRAENRARKKRGGKWVEGGFLLRMWPVGAKLRAATGGGQEEEE